MTLVSECRGGVRLVSGSVRQCQAILTVPTCVQCQWCQSCQDRASEKGPRGQFGPTRSPDVNECSHRVVWVIWPSDNTQFTLGVPGANRSAWSLFIGPVLTPLTPLTLCTRGQKQCQYSLTLPDTIVRHRPDTSTPVSIDTALTPLDAPTLRHCRAQRGWVAVSRQKSEDERHGAQEDATRWPLHALAVCWLTDQRANIKTGKASNV